MIVTLFGILINTAVYLVAVVVAMWFGRLLQAPKKYCKYL